MKKPSLVWGSIKISLGAGLIVLAVVAIKDGWYYIGAAIFGLYNIGSGIIEVVKSRRKSKIDSDGDT